MTVSGEERSPDEPPQQVDHNISFPYVMDEVEWNKICSERGAGGAEGKAEGSNSQVEDSSHGKRAERAEPAEGGLAEPRSTRRRLLPGAPEEAAAGSVAAAEVALVTAPVLQPPPTATAADAFQAYSSRFHGMFKKELLADADFWVDVEAACHAHAILRTWVPAGQAFKEKITKQLQSMWTLNKLSWEQVVSKRRTTESSQNLPQLSEDQLAALFAYTLNAPPLFLIFNVAARSFPRSRTSLWEVLDLTFEAATHLEHEDGVRTYYRGMAEAESTWYLNGGSLPCHFISCSHSKAGARSFGSVLGTAVIKVTVHTGVESVKLSSVTAASCTEDEVVVIPQDGAQVAAICNKDGKLTELVIRSKDNTAAGGSGNGDGGGGDCGGEAAKATDYASSPSSRADSAPASVGLSADAQGASMPSTPNVTTSGSADLDTRRSWDESGPVSLPRFKKSLKVVPHPSAKNLADHIMEHCPEGVFATRLSFNDEPDVPIPLSILERCMAKWQDAHVARQFQVLLVLPGGDILQPGRTLQQLLESMPVGHNEIQYLEAMEVNIGGEPKLFAGPGSCSRLFNPIQQKKHLVPCPTGDKYFVQDLVMALVLSGSVGPRDSEEGPLVLVTDSGQVLSPGTSLTSQDSSGGRVCGGVSLQRLRHCFSRGCISCPRQVPLAAVVGGWVSLIPSRLDDCTIRGMCASCQAKIPSTQASKAGKAADEEALLRAWHPEEWPTPAMLAGLRARSNIQPFTAGLGLGLKQVENCHVAPVKPANIPHAGFWLGWASSATAKPFSAAHQPLLQRLCAKWKHGEIPLQWPMEKVSGNPPQLPFGKICCAASVKYVELEDVEACLADQACGPVCLVQDRVIVFESPLAHTGNCSAQAVMFP